MIKEVNASQDKIKFIDVPLLFEANFDLLCDYTLVVACSKEIQIKRLIKRNNITKQEAIKMIESQMSQEEKVQKASFVVYNDSDSLEDLYYKIDQLIKKVEAL